MQFLSQIENNVLIKKKSFPKEKVIATIFFKKQRNDIILNSDLLSFDNI